MQHVPQAAGVQFIGTPNGRLLKVKPRKPTKEDEQRRFAEVIVMIVDDDGNHKPACALLDSGCSRSIILKEFTSRKRRTSSRKVV